MCGPPGRKGQRSRLKTTVDVSDRIDTEQHTEAPNIFRECRHWDWWLKCRYWGYALRIKGNHQVSTGVCSLITLSRWHENVCVKRSLQNWAHALHCMFTRARNFHALVGTLAIWVGLFDWDQRIRALVMHLIHAHHSLNHVHMHACRGNLQQIQAQEVTAIDSGWIMKQIKCTCLEDALSVTCPRWLRRRDWPIASGEKRTNEVICCCQRHWNLDDPTHYHHHHQHTQDQHYDIELITTNLKDYRASSEPALLPPQNHRRYQLRWETCHSRFVRNIQGIQGRSNDFTMLHKQINDSQL